jgi:hypothetical protein
MLNHGCKYTSYTLWQISLDEMEVTIPYTVAAEADYG